MNYSGMSTEAICRELGERIKNLRLRKNLTQEEVANRARLSLNPIKALEKGQGKISTVIAVLGVLGTLEALDAFIPETPISPIQLARMQGKKRRRSSGSRTQKPSDHKVSPKW